jgi:hypothetical protein
MCFSAEASFAAGVALLPAGAFCLRQALKKDVRFLALASVPVLFGLQQLCEGLVWVGLESGNPALARGAAFFFLFFALPFWPFWIPASSVLLEAGKRTRLVLLAGALLGSAFGWTLYAPTVQGSDRWLSVRMVHHSIQYDLTVLPAFRMVPPVCWTLLYLAVVFAPLLLSSDVYFRLFLVTLALAAAVSYVFFRYAFESVWCFFAAVLSLQLCHAFRHLPAANSLAMQTESF